MTIFTVDVSHHDWDRRGSALDWGKIRAAGIQGMCAKATEGDPSGYDYADPRFTAHCQGARAAGITLIGGYHVLSRGDQAGINRQVDWLRQQLGKIGGIGSAGVWAMIDVEPFPELVQRGIAPRWDDVRRFADRWHSVTGGFPLAVYLPKWVWSGNLGFPDMSALRGPLVSSNYGPNAALAPAALYAARGGVGGPGWPAYGRKTPELWQFGSQSVVPGCSAATDVNAFEGTLPQLIQRLTGTTPPQEEDMTPDQAAQLQQVYNAIFFGGNSMGATATAKVNAKSAGNALVDLVQDLRVNSAALRTQLTALQPLDADALAQRLLAVMTPAAVADAVVAALPAELASQVVTELGARISPVSF